MAEPSQNRYARAEEDSQPAHLALAGTSDILDLSDVKAEEVARIHIDSAS